MLDIKRWKLENAVKIPGYYIVTKGLGRIRFEKNEMDYKIYNNILDTGNNILAGTFRQTGDEKPPIRPLIGFFNVKKIFVFF